MWTNLKTCIILIVVFESASVWSVASKRRLFPKSRSRLHVKHVKSAIVKKNHVPLEYSGFSITEAIPEIEQPPSFESSSEELPAEKGELGIPEQYMRVRHGVYKGPVAVFVDSVSREEHFVVTNRKNLHYKQVHLTTTVRTPSQTAKTKVAKITVKTSTATTRRVTTTTTKQPLKHNSTYVAKKIMPQSGRMMSADSVLLLESPIKKTCLHMGSHCRRHNECCTHHCNWRMGLKCDYAIW